VSIKLAFLLVTVSLYAEPRCQHNHLGQLIVMDERSIDDDHFRRIGGVL
jgi:hypothetical protein